MSQLSIGTLLNNGKYIIQNVLGQGGFGVTYLALHTALEKQVVIKEFFMRGYMSRQADNSVKPDTLSLEEFEKFKGKFLEEARLLAKFDGNPYIVDVLDHFEENKTAYFVMPYVKGISLTDFAAKQPNGKISEENSIKIMRQLAIALSDMHKKQILHRDIKPDNVLVTEKGSIILIDFGAAREHITAEFSQKHSIMLTPGYAPPEQYDAYADRGAYTDIYALGALLYRLLTGVVPTAAPARLTQSLKSPKELNASVSKHVNDAILKAMELDPVFRFQSVAAFINALMQQPTEKPVVETPSIKQEIEEEKPITPPPPKVEPKAEPQPPITPAQKPKEEEETITPLEMPEDLTPPKPEPKPKIQDKPKVQEKSPTQDKLKEADKLMEQGKAEAALAIYKELFTQDSGNKIVRERIKTCQDILAKQQEQAAKTPSNSSFWKKIGYGVGAILVIGALGGGWYLGSPKGKTTEKGDTIPEMKLIEGGSFFMGMVGNGEEDEKPLHQVLVAPFYMSATEVTIEQYRAYCKAEKQPIPLSVPQTGKDDYPVYNVSRNDAIAYCNWLSNQTKKKFRLPTEAEWEFAAKGGKYAKSNNLYSGGNNPVPYACYGQSDFCAVRQKQPNELGLYGMSGNVWEWCGDWYGKNYYKECIKRTQRGELVKNPTGPNIGTLGVLRGGGYNSNAHDIRVSDRLYQIPTQFNPKIPMGFRVVQEFAKS